MGPDTVHVLHSIVECSTCMQEKRNRTVLMHKKDNFKHRTLQQRKKQYNQVPISSDNFATRGIFYIK